MPRLNTQQSLQAAQRLPFCYLCGGLLAEVPKDKKDGDHVPPRKVFAKEDRDCPLILPVHTSCHKSASEWDQLTTDFISLLHDSNRTRQVIGKHIAVVSESTQLIVLRGVPLSAIIGRFLRGFHAALYHEYLPSETHNVILPPFPAAAEHDGRLSYIEIPTYFHEVVKILRRCRVAEQYDEISCFNDRCRYLCVWTKTDTGEPCCCFGLRIYSWEKLANNADFPRRTCVGMYSINSVPDGATQEA